MSLVKAVEPRLVVADTRSRLFPGRENDNSESAQVVGILERLARASGAAVVLVAHTSKDSRKRDDLAAALDPSATRGGSALTDNARAAIGVARIPDEDAIKKGHEGGQPVVLLKSTKNNFGPAGGQVYAVRTSAGGLRRTTLNLRPVPGHADLVERIVTTVAELAREGQAVTRRAFCRGFASRWKPDFPKVSARALGDLVDGLILEGRLVASVAKDSSGRARGEYLTLETASEEKW